MKKNPRNTFLLVLATVLIVLGWYLIYNYLKMSADIIAPVNVSEYDY